METNLQNQVKNNSSQKQQNPKQDPSPISSSCSSPSHDFSFTISLSSSSSSSSKLIKGPTTKTTDPFAVDLSPADEIFFHGHLLPLHLLSHLPVSPRTSTSSYNDGFTLPVNDTATSLPTTNNNNNNENALSLTNISTDPKNNNNVGEIENRVNNKPIKSFSLFSLSKWRKQEQEQEQQHQQQQQQQQQKKKLMSLDLSHAVKKYIRMLFQRRENGTQFRNIRQTSSSYSFSSALLGSKGNNKTMNISDNSYNKRDLIRARRGELFSAPASMRTSPTNSGHLRVSATGLSSSSASTSSSSSESTMEELQAAIQAAIAHCKNSSAIDRDDKVKDS